MELENLRPVEIIAVRLRLRAFCLEDAQDLYEYLSDPAVYQFEPGEPVDRAGAQARAAQMSTAKNFWAVELLETRKVIGQIYFNPLEPPDRLTWELGYILSPSYQRRGYAAEAVSALLRAAFRTWKAHRVFANCNPENAASWKLLEKLGFRREGLLKKEIFFRRDARGNPLWTDTLVYAMLEEEYLSKETG
jgi:RimJ/RimL family protein N-acetyltransferase